jgi:DNA polymerase-3 subunit gamma/tau
VSSQALYRRWRSRTFDDLVGQDHIVQTIRNAVRFNRIAHAYLFTGPRGTGKTSMARLVAKAVNCTNPRDGGPCGTCDACVSIAEARSPDVIELDAASSGLVDDIRALREGVAYAPTHLRYKVYIIDEVHRLGPAAFEALLKTVEEPPPHVLFIFASTEPHRIPVTIVSRCQRFDFRRIDPVTTVARLRVVAEQEGMTVEDDAFLLIAQQSSGSLRDALGILDQVRSFAGESIVAEDVRSGIGLGRPEVVAGITDAMIANQSGISLKLIHEAAMRGIDPRTLLRQLIEYWRELLLYAAGSGADENLDPLLADAAHRHGDALKTVQVLRVLRALTEQVIEPRLSVPVELPLEIAVTQATVNLHPRDEAKSPAPVSPVPEPTVTSVEHAVREQRDPAPTVTPPPKLRNGQEVGVDDGVQAPVHDDAAVGLSTIAEDPPFVVTPVPAVHASGIEPSDLSAVLNESWPRVIETAGNRSKTLQGLLRGVEHKAVIDSEVTLGFKYPFHRDQSDRLENRQITESIIGEILGSRIKVRCVTVEVDTNAVIADEADMFAAEAERRLRGVHARHLRKTRPDA